MPFVTEELWQRFVQGTSEHPVSISLADYPQPAKDGVDPQREAPFALMQEIVTAAREVRADNKLDPKTVYPAGLEIRTGNLRPEDLSAIASVARLDIKLGNQGLPAGGLLRSAGAFDLRIDAQPPSSNGAAAGDSRARLEKEIVNYERLIANSHRQLSDQTFVSKAPEKVVATLRTKLAEYEAQLAKSRSLLEGLQ
jgi:valyl-tRNA synthetase